MLLLSPAMGLVVNALIYLPLTIWLLTVPYTGHSRESVAPMRRALVWRDAFEVIREVSGNRPIITMVVLAGCVSFFVGTAFQATMPEFAHDLGAEKADFGRQCRRRGDRRVFARGPRLASAAGPNRNDQRDSVVCRDRRIRVFFELFSVPFAPVHRRSGEPDFFFYGADDRAAAITAPPPWSFDRLVRHGQHGPQSL